jgi:hypothetical protein
MLKRLFLIFLTLISLISLISGAQVDIKSNIYNEYSLFTYTFYFDLDDNYKSFSFEKPKNARIDYAIDNLGNTVKIGFAGDYFIVEPEDNTENKTFEIRYISSEVSQSIINDAVFSQYVNFNFPVTSLSFVINFEDEVGTIEDVFPRYYEQVDDNTLRWELGNLESDTLFLINFEKEGDTFLFSTSEKMYYLGWLILLVLFGILFYIYFIFIKKRLIIPNKSKNKPIPEKKVVKKVSKKTKEVKN